MKRVLVGHRGVGKTSLLERYQKSYPALTCIDLDHAIEIETGTKIADFFAKSGEAAFRETEKNVFYKIITQNENFMMAVGGGFNVSIIPADIEVVFVSRVTDSEGRIFLNRPRLDPDQAPIEEYKMRYLERQPQFMSRADRVYHMPEGAPPASSVELQILDHDFVVQDAYYTLLNSEIPKLSQIKKNYKRIELRTDLIDPQEILKIVQHETRHDWLVSIRTQCVSVEFPKSVKIDRDIQFLSAAADIISSHHEKIQLAIAELKSYEKLSVHLKLSPLIHSFDELIMGYEWQQSDPHQRSFLPRSPSGRWLWYRQAAKYLQKINFVKGKQCVLDQPSLYQWLTLPTEKPLHWGAVLGQPVNFSRSPLEHEEFFRNRKSYFTVVDLSPREFTEHILFLGKLGLAFIAVTSPLKESLFDMAHEASELAQRFRSANTLFYKNGLICVDNTDYAGFQQLAKHLNNGNAVAVWGGGGTLEMMKATLPEAHFYSSQTGLLRDADKQPLATYRALIWAAPRKSETTVPPDEMVFTEVVDLNYVQNSMGLEVAEKRKARYTSGLEMFRIQAEWQQKFWAASEICQLEKISK